MKKTILVLMLAAMLVLSGCSLVVKDPEVDARQVILDINGQTVDKQTVTGVYNGLLNQEYQMQQMYQMYGMQAPPIDYDQLLQSAKDESIRKEILKQQAQAQGIDRLDEAAEAELQQEVAAEWEQTMEWVQGNYLPETELEGEELEHELEHLAQDLGITSEAVEAAVREQFLEKKLEESATAAVTVPDEDVKADYDAKVEEAKASYEADPNAYGTAVNSGNPVYFAPAGYRMVKQVLIKFLPEDQEKIDALTADKTAAETELSDAQSAVTRNEEAMAAEDLKDEDKQALEAQVPGLAAAVTAARQKLDQANADVEAAKQAGYAAILPKAQEVVTRARNEEFDLLVKELNEDPGMPQTGYAVRKGFSSFDEAFVLPAMALENVGDVAQPSPGIYGYYVVQYAADVPEGAVSYDSVKDGLHEALLTAKKAAVWQDTVEGWVNDADIKEYMSRLED